MVPLRMALWQRQRNGHPEAQPGVVGEALIHHSHSRSIGL